MAASGAAAFIGPAIQAGMQQSQNFDQGMWSLIQHFLNHNRSPYGKGYDAARPFFDQARNTQNPFYQNGQQAMGKYNDWLSTMKDPSGFINSQMNNYSQSPWAKNLQNSSMRAGQNLASANGLSGSTPFAQQMQQNASNISSQDQDKWLQNVLGVNRDYGGGLNNEMNMGQHAGDMISQLYQQQGDMAGGAAYGDTSFDNQRQNELWAALAKMFGGGG